MEALKNVSFSMEKGEFAAVVGESLAPAKARCYTVSAGWSNLPPDTSTWMAGICLHCEKTSARSSGGKHRVYFSILPAGGGINSGAEYRLPPPAGWTQTR